VTSCARAGAGRRRGHQAVTISRCPPGSGAAHEALDLGNGLERVAQQEPVGTGQPGDHQAIVRPVATGELVELVAEAQPHQDLAGVHEVPSLLLRPDAAAGRGPQTVDGIVLAETQLERQDPASSDQLHGPSALHVERARVRPPARDGQPTEQRERQRAIDDVAGQQGQEDTLARGLTSYQLTFFAYLGFEHIANFAEGMHRPERHLPRAMFLAIAGSTAIYALVAVSVVAVVDWRDLAASEAPLALVARLALGARADLALTCIALAATANTVLMVLLSASRSVYGMAAAGVLPRRLARVGRRGTPAASGLVVGVTALLVMPADLAQVAKITDAAMLLGFVLMNLSVGVLAVRGRLGGHGRRRVVDVVVPATGVILCAWLLLHTGIIAVTATAVLLAVGLVGRFGVGRVIEGGAPALEARG
jgi:hypothetical protein